MKKIHTVAELEAMSSKELVALYNEYARKEITKFSDRKTAVQRTFDILPMATDGKQEVVKVAAQAVKVAVTTTATAKAKGEKPSKAKKEPKQPSDRGAAIAASWKDPKVFAKRVQRTHVKASGQIYRSVREAFEALGLPMSKHIKFRMELKAVHELTFKHEGRQVKFSVAAQE